MNYAEVITDEGTYCIALGIARSRRRHPAKYFMRRTDVGGFDLLRALMHDRFNNSFAEEDYRYSMDMHRDSRYSELFRDTVHPYNGNPGSSDIVYTHNAGSLGRREVVSGGREDVHEERLILPPSGFYVPENGGLVFEHTLVPRRTVERREEAESLWREADIPTKFLMYFRRPKDISGGRLVRRTIRQDNGNEPYYCIDFDLSTTDRIGCGFRPLYDGRSEITMTLDLRK